MSAQGSSRSGPRCGARGFSLIELLVALAIFSVIVLAVARLTDVVLRRLTRAQASDDRWSIELGAVPALREDVRRSSGFAPLPPGLDPGVDVLVLDRSGGRGERLVVWSLTDGVIGRRELRRTGDDRWDEGARQDWRSRFELRLRGRPASAGRQGLVTLLVDSTGPRPERLLSFAFRVRP